MLGLAGSLGAGAGLEGLLGAGLEGAGAGLEGLEVEGLFTAPLLAGFEGLLFSAGFSSFLPLSLSASLSTETVVSFFS